MPGNRGPSAIERGLKGLEPAKIEARGFVQAETINSVVCTYLHSDVDDMGPFFAEIEPVLPRGGRFVYIGVHTCFAGHFVERKDDGSYVIHPGYWESGWHFDSPYWGDGVRKRVGNRHTTLSELIGALLATGLRLDGLVEPKGEPIAWNLALVAAKT